jgi:hypothetical protein
MPKFVVCDRANEVNTILRQIIGIESDDAARIIGVIVCVPKFGSR